MAQDNQPYSEYLEHKCRSQKDHIEWLQTELKDKQGDLIAAWSASAMLLLVLGIVLYQWLVAHVPPPM